MTSGKWDKKSTLLPLNYLSSLMADTLFFSYYDIMIIQSSYLILWSKTDSFSKVPLITLLSMFDPQYHGVITSYFKNGISLLVLYILHRHIQFKRLFMFCVFIFIF